MASSVTTGFGPGDLSLALLRDGYEFWGRRREREQSTVVRARILGQRATCVVGPEAARRFYEEPGLERSSALPAPIVRTLLGHGAVHTLDGDAHRDRKAWFVDVLDPAAVGQVAGALDDLWDEEAPAWGDVVDVFDVVPRLLLRAGCRWVGLPDPGERTGALARDMLRMVDAFGGPGPRHWRAYRARERVESWVEEEIKRARHLPPAGTPLATAAYLRDVDGTLLPSRVAAVEVVNLVRPLVAVTWLVSGLARLLAADHTLRDRMEDPFAAVEVAQEVRRTTPFVPFLAARATRELDWDGVRVPRGTLVVLDVWGTDHDARAWNRPYDFDPDRYQRSPVTPYNLVPQGGGRVADGHRCPGEDLTLAALVTIGRRLAETPYGSRTEPPSLRRMPPEPEHLLRLAGR